MINKKALTKPFTRKNDKENVAKIEELWPLESRKCSKYSSR